ncbi:hypothetical protein PR048_002142 [Dryococelus australis]|uniref:Uncharacterized protein n=1 Tax=Dryococelus australis TaxID=614101 RepID=A0ABQ9IK45_9NEOP|nr:hypothetical protein PR048_002142 [Dryococelus australis]
MAVAETLVLLREYFVNQIESTQCSNTANSYKEDLSRRTSSTFWKLIKTVLLVGNHGGHSDWSMGNNDPRQNEESFCVSKYFYFEYCYTKQRYVMTSYLIGGLISHNFKLRNTACGEIELLTEKA